MGSGSHRGGEPEPGAARPRRERLRWAALSAALAALPAALVVALSGGSPAHASTLSADYVHTGSWPDGYSGQYILRNDGSDTVKGWTLRFGLPEGTRLATVWNGRLDRTDGTYTVRNEDWNKALSPGESIVVGFEARQEADSFAGAGASGPQAPTACTINEKPCNVPASGTPDLPSGTARSFASTEPATATPRRGTRSTVTSTPSATPTPTATATGMPTGTSSPSSTTSATATPTSPKTTAPADVAVKLAPYVDMTLAQPFDPTSTPIGTGVRDRTLAYIVDGGDCRPMWGGVTRLDDPAIAARTTALREAGGIIRVAFGGSGGTDLAAVCATPELLAAAYRQVLDATGATRVDLDIEGRSLVDPEVVRRRNAAVRLLQEGGRAAGAPVTVAYTLPVDPTRGLGEEAGELLRDAVTQNVDVEYVNIKASDYGAGAAPRPAGKMGRFAIDAARIVHAQIREVWPQATDEQAWNRVSVTVMIGRNNVADEVFTLDDARELAAFADRTPLGRIAWWSAARDRACPENENENEVGVDHTDVVPTCSGVPQDDEEFLHILGG